MASKGTAQPTLGSVVFVKLSGRIGEVVKHTPADPVTTHKIRFKDKSLPGEDWFAAHSIALLPILGSLARVKSTNRVGTLAEHTPKDEKLSYKLSFSDGVKPKADWFPRDNVDVQPGLNDLQQRAEVMRRETLEQLTFLQKAIRQDFAEYKSRLEMMGAAKTASSVAKIAMGFIPGGHVVAETASAAAYMSDLQQLISDCTDVGFLGADVYTMYQTRSWDLDKEEASLLNVLTRPLKMIGEKYVLGGPDDEPGQRVLQSLLKMKALCERLNTLDAMGFFSAIPIKRSKL